MIKNADEFYSLAKPGRRPIYPWDRWLAKGSRHILKQGKDFRGSLETMTTLIRVTCRKRGRTISIHRVQNRPWLLIKNPR